MKKTNFFLEDITSREFFKFSKAYPDVIDEIPCIASNFINRLSSVASLRLQVVDSHRDHPGRHYSSQLAAWNAVSDMFSLFKRIPYGDSTLFDRTTFLVVTEFSRAPFLNSQLGKDHNLLTNSVLLAGNGIKGNVTVGKSEVISRKRSSTGKAIYQASGEHITPEHIAQVILNLKHNEKKPALFKKMQALESILV